METCCPTPARLPWHDGRHASGAGTTTRLDAGRAYPVRAAARIRCLAGDVWITQEGNPRDIVLARGGEFVPARRGKIVVQALSDDAAIRVVGVVGG